jgi:hypothetical protein
MGALVENTLRLDVAAVQRHQDFSHHRPGDLSAFLCNILEAHNVKPVV